MTCPVPGCCGGVALAGGNRSCLQAGGSLGSTLLTPPGGSFPARRGFAHVLVPTGSPSGAVFPWARPRELRPLGLPGPPPPSPVSPAQSCPGSASVCPPVPRPGNSRCELERSAGRLVSRLRITVLCCSMFLLLHVQCLGNP